MKVGDIMTPKVAVVQANMTIDEAARRMKELDVGALAVQSDGRIMGLVTDRDIVIRAVAAEKHACQTKVEDIMSPHPIVCRLNEDIEDAAKLFAAHKVRRLLVQDDSGRVVGMVSLGDLAIDAEDSELVRDVMKRISEADRDKWERRRHSAQESTVGAHVT